MKDISKLAKTHLVDRLIDNALEEKLFFDRRGKVGERILKLSPEERKICETLTSSDFNGRTDIQAFEAACSFEKFSKYGV